MQNREQRVYPEDIVITLKVLETNYLCAPFLFLRFSLFAFAFCLK